MNKNDKGVSHFYIETRICPICNKEFKVEIHPLNKNDRLRFGNKTCSRSCGAKYRHMNMTLEEKESIANKRKKTCLKKYGDEYVINSKYARQKTKEKLGVERPQWQNNYGEICKNSYLKKHGHPHKLTNETKRLIKKTKLERYGTYMPQLKYKSYRFPSGKTIKIQGYENYVLDYLLTKYDESEIAAGTKEIKTICGNNITYMQDDFEHVYYPDIFIKPTNTFIEVKSKFTYDINLEKNLLKREAVIKLGYNFKFMIIKNIRYGNDIIEI